MTCLNHGCDNEAREDDMFCQACRDWMKEVMIAENAPKHLRNNDASSKPGNKAESTTDSEGDDFAIPNGAD